MSILDLTGAEYHADPCDTPSLTASVANILIQKSPAHARAAHPKLNPNLEREDKTIFDLGSTTHALLLEGRDTIEVVEAKDWKTNAAKAARDDARARGMTPLLPDQAVRVRAMVAAVEAQLPKFNTRPALLAPAGKPEQTVTFEDNGVQCRALIDWLHDDRLAIDDIKTTSGSASPEKWSRTMFDRGYDVQAAFYIRALRALGHYAAFRFVVVETFEPFAVSVFEPGPDVLTVADAKIDFALKTWAECLETGVWPAYPLRVCTVELPPWEETRWFEREERAAA